jgi:hypothetical protein
MQAYILPPVRNLWIGYLFSLVLGGVLIEWIMTILRNRSETISRDKDYRKRDIYLVRMFGGLERLLYTTCILFNQPSGIAAWLAIKVLTRWTNEREKEGWATISKSNIYLIGNLLTVLFGVAGGLLCILLPV